VLSSIQDYTGNVNGPILWNLNLLDARQTLTSSNGVPGQRHPRGAVP